MPTPSPDAYLEGMAAEPDQELAGEYHAALVTERNARMARRMAEWLEAEEEGDYFVTLGLLHLVLEGDSVPGCLEKMGYTVGAHPSGECLKAATFSARVRRAVILYQ